MYKKGKAFDREYGSNKEYGKKTITLCEIERGMCPYGNEGHFLECEDGKSRIMCKTNARVNKKGLIRKI